MAASVLHPIDPTTIVDAEKETEAPWIVRKLVGSMTGRIIMASYETLRAAGTSVVCLSPWGDSSPLLLPCVRFRDLVIHTVIVATGGTAAIAAPVMGPITEGVVGTIGSSILVETLSMGFEVSTKAANDLIFDKAAKHIIPKHSERLHTTAVKKLLITLKFKHTISDAALGFFRSPVHKDSSLFSSIIDYLSVEKGWFSPYLFASGRRPIIPRSMQPDVVFCHGPFLTGDYNIGERLLGESASVISFCLDPPPKPPTLPEQISFSKLLRVPSSGSKVPTPGTPPSRMQEFLSNIPVLNRSISRSSSPEPKTPQTESNPPPAVESQPEATLSPPPRRMLIVVVGISPHRTLWTTSARPGESVMNYILLNGCPAVVVPVKPGSPLLAWDTLTLEGLQKLEDGVDGKKFDGVVEILFEYVSLCVDWERVILPVDDDGQEQSKSEVDDPGKEQSKEEFIKDAIGVLVAGAVRSGESKQVKKDVVLDRAGIVMFRIP